MVIRTKTVYTDGTIQSSKMSNNVIRSFHIIHNVVDRGVLHAMWDELAGKVVHRDQLIICQLRLSENALLALAVRHRSEILTFRTTRTDRWLTLIRRLNIASTEMFILGTCRSGSCSGLCSWLTPLCEPADLGSRCYEALQNAC